MGLGNTVELRLLALRLVPETLDTVDVVPIVREELAVIDPEVAVRKLDLIAVNGKDQQGVVYEIIRSDGSSAMVQDVEALAQFDEGALLYRSRDGSPCVISSHCASGCRTTFPAELS